jgi:hypothetical protein
MGTIILIVAIIAARTILARLFPDFWGVVEAIMECLEIFL